MEKSPYGLVQCQCNELDDKWKRRDTLVVYGPLNWGRCWAWYACENHAWVSFSNAWTEWCHNLLEFIHGESSWLCEILVHGSCGRDCKSHKAKWKKDKKFLGEFREILIYKKLLGGVLGYP